MAATEKLNIFYKIFLNITWHDNIVIKIIVPITVPSKKISNHQELQSKKHKKHSEPLTQKSKGTYIVK